MIFNDNEQLSNIYSNITKQATPSKDQLVQQSPVLSRTDLSKDQDLIAEAYAGMLTEAKEPCCPCTIGKKCTKERCACTACKKSLKESQLLEAKKKAKKPDDDGDGVPNWADKKAGKDDKKNKAMKESSMFKTLFMSIINEKDKLKSVKAAHQK